MKNFTRSALLIATAWTMSVAPSSAATYTWDVSNGTWDTSTPNWLDEAPSPATWVNGNEALFQGDTGGVVTVGSDITSTGVTINGNGNWTFQTGSLGGTGGILKNGTGTLTLSNANSFTGGITVSKGTLVVGNNTPSASGGTITLGDDNTGTDTVQLTLAAGVLGFTNNITVNATNAVLRYNGTTGVNLTVEATPRVLAINGNLTFEAPNMTAEGSFNLFSELTGSGTLTIGITGGNRIAFRTNSPNFTGNVVIANGGVTEFRNNILSNDNGVDVEIQNGGRLSVSFGPTTLGKLNGASGAIVYVASNANTLTLGKGTTSSDSATYAGTIQQITGLTKIGDGTQILSGTNSYTSATNVNGGTLLFNSTSGTGNIAVASGATVGGTGTLNGVTTIASGGTLLAGAGGVGDTLTLNKNVTLQSGSVLQFVLGAGNDNNSSLNITGGTLAFDTNQTILFSDLGATANTTYTLITGLAADPGVSGWNYSGLDAGLSGDFSYESGSLRFTTIPEPSTYALFGAAGVIGLLAFRRRR